MPAPQFPPQIANGTYRIRSDSSDPKLYLALKTDNSVSTATLNETDPSQKVRPSMQAGIFDSHAS
jgi:hypothetical protein